MTNHNIGHRKRIREQFLKHDIRSMPDYEILEMLLYYAIPRADTKALAKDLLKKFGSFAAIINAEPIELKSFDGLGEASIFLFKLLLDFNSRLMIDPQDKKFDVMNHWAAVLNYCRLTMGHKKKEHFRVLYLNKKNHLLSDEFHEDGTIDKIQVYPREIAKKVIEHAASAIILIHNHPSSDVSPSNDDIEITKIICKAISPLGAVVHDHLIISNHDHFSFRSNKLL